MKPWLTEKYGNPSTLYSIGREARKAVTTAREQIASCLGCDPEHVIFVSGGTEADNMAIFGAVQIGLRNNKERIVTSEFEHHAVLHTIQYHEYNQFPVAYIKPNKLGYIFHDDVEEEVLKGGTALVSVMTVNNEIGTIQPIKLIAEVAHDHGALFHTDAVQAVGHIPINIKADKIDLLSLSSHKLHGPKGVGALICTVPDFPQFMYGGGQEHGMRPGTENVAGIVGMAAALKEATDNMEDNQKYVAQLKGYLVEKLKAIDGVYFNGDCTAKTGILNIRVDGVEGEALLLMLDQRGICVAAGSACTSGSINGSHVLRSLGLTRKEAHSSIRISLDHTNTIDEVDIFVREFYSILDRLR